MSKYTGDYLLLAYSVGRKAGEPLTTKHAYNCASIASELAQTVRENPWSGEVAATVCNLYKAAEAIRNPSKRPFGPGRGTNDSFDYWLDGISTPWAGLCSALDELAEFYGLQGFSIGNSPTIDSDNAPAIPSEILGRIGQTSGNILKRIDEATGGDSAGGVKDAEADSVTTVSTGFLGGAGFADALGVHSTRRAAFLRNLDRRREQRTLGDDCWHEVSDPRPNSPRFLYRVDSPELRDLAARYKEPRLA